MLTVIKISANLERCGDYAKNMAKRTTVLVQMHARRQRAEVDPPDGARGRE